ncbi:hypothetical protein PU629_06060 [Pullulanibacillus sp. KACC 23026]|uniref:hypothetical protein n=1 Tax=Pullulanibacillus sp. KACC 23026 TaxID=3028315 RepID=UPI0023B1628B|nr:hypothetical protein [Pullulanibacillus sp. KACC 23026]WEG13929.1 hypothetical protein PU629_06060 [Pullulanibacillus sp. KACC 23026]
MGGMAQIVLSNFLFFAMVVIIIIYVLYLLIKRVVEKNDGDYSSEAKEGNREPFLRKLIFTFLYSALTSCLIYLVDSDKTGAMISFVVFFIFGLLIPKRPRKPNSSLSRIISIVFLLGLVVLTVLWDASISVKVWAWLILFIMYLLEKIEMKYFISDNTNGQDL